MKQMIDQAHKNNSRTAKELAVLYMRFKLVVDRTIAPQMMKVQFTQPKVAKMMASIQNQVFDAEQKINPLVQQLAKQGNSSSIPGLSTPGASLPATTPSKSVGQAGVVGVPYGQISTNSAASTANSSAASNPYATSSNAYGANSGAAAATGGKQYFAYGQMPTNQTTTTASTSNPYSGQSYGQYGVQSQVTQQPSTSSSFRNNTGMRTVVCPIEVVAEFLKVSNFNTNKKIETCAILGGEERNGELIITTLIVPTQTGKQDMCTMDDEVELFEAQIAEGCITLGWIHTHP